MSVSGRRCSARRAAVASSSRSGRADSDGANSVANHRRGLQEVRQGGRHVADLVADRLPVPGGQPGVGGRRGVVLDRRLLDQDVAAHAVLVAEAEQPVDADRRRLADRDQGLQPRQAVAAGGQELGKGRAVEPDGGGEHALAHAGARHGLRQPGTKAFQEPAPIHLCPSPSLPWAPPLACRAAVRTPSGRAPAGPRNACRRASLLRRPAGVNGRGRHRVAAGRRARAVAPGRRARPSLRLTRWGRSGASSRRRRPRRGAPPRACRGPRRRRARRRPPWRRARSPRRGR